LQDLNDLQSHANAYLSANGKVAGRDFAPDKAVEAANDLAYELEVQRLKAECPVETGDAGCEPNCTWDGESRRCECGNRRMQWERGFTHSFLDPWVYAAPY